MARPRRCWWSPTTRPVRRPPPRCCACCGLELEAWLAAGDRTLDFVVATGTHRVALPEELDHIFGADLVAAHAARIHSHNAKAKDELVNLGRTARGTEILVNRLLAEAGSVVLINSVEPHYFAGYTGGRKSLFPGIAGYETVWANHKLSMQPGSELLMLEGNPVHEDLMEQLAIGIAGKQVYSIQLVLDEEHHIGFAAAGELEASWRQAITVADKQFVLEIERPYEVVVAVAPHPMDCNFYQTNKAIQSGALALAEGGVLIVVSECPFGLGENQTLVRHAVGGRLSRRRTGPRRPRGVQAGRAAGHPHRGDPPARGDLGGHLAPETRTCGPCS